METKVDGTGASACTPCEPGWFSTLPNTALCSKCGPASFAPEAGSRQCKLCPAGFITGDGGNGASAMNATACNACPLRTFRPSQFAANECTLCPKGRETRMASGATTCTAW